MLFQKAGFNFSYIQLALTIYKNEIRNLTDSNHVESSLKLDWNKIAKIILNSQNELFEDDIKLIQSTTKTYCEALIHNLDDRFPEPEVLFAFRIFDVKEIPLDA